MPAPPSTPRPCITTVTYEEAAHGGLEATDIVHRPSQIFDDGDLRLVHPLGRRMVVTQQDLIAFRSESINAVPDLWGPLRMATRLALAVADHVVFFTETTRQDALRDDLVSAERSSVVGIGVDHRVAHADAPVAPAGVDPGEPYLLTLGSDWPHKNLAFAHRLGEQLGIRVLGAGSGAELGQVTEAEKAWLLEHAAAVAYPTLYEGFGLVPFEAGAAGVPCLFAPVSTLAELFPPELAILVPWDVEASAAAVRPLLEPGPARERARRGPARGRPRGTPGTPARVSCSTSTAARSPRRCPSARRRRPTSTPRWTSSTGPAVCAASRTRSTARSPWSASGCRASWRPSAMRASRSSGPTGCSTRPISAPSSPSSTARRCRRAFRAAYRVARRGA